MVSRLWMVTTLFGVIVASGWVSAQMEPSPRRSGQAIYEDFCFRCHGLRGLGDGPDAEKLPVKPANFLSSSSRSKTEFELLTIVSAGVAFTPMHAWRGKISDDEMLEAISYIRQLAPAQPSF